MRLELGSFSVEQIEFGSPTALRGRTLVVDRQELRQLVLEDAQFADVAVRLARPGESVRIVHALDVVEPRWKVAGPGGVFPGFVAPPTTVGEGRTHRLAGVAVIEVGEPVPGEPTHFRERLVDMAGPGAEYSPFAKTLNLVLEVEPNRALFPPAPFIPNDMITGDPSAVAYNRALKLAGMKVAARLARVTEGLRPDHLEAFELSPCGGDLPKVVGMYQWRRQTSAYGKATGFPLGSLLHPNEFFDGAVVDSRSSSSAGCTYWEQNNQVLMGLCRRHGKELDFRGCVIFGDMSPYRSDKDRIANAGARLARRLGADCALFLGINGSNLAIDLMLTIQQCERAGIKTALLYYDVGNGPEDPGFIYATPEADAIVCVGSREQRITLPKLDKVIGGERLVNPDLDATGELTVPMRYLHSALGIEGYSHLTTRFV